MGVVKHCEIVELIVWLHFIACFSQLLRRETASEKLCEERDELRAKMEHRGRECVHLNQTKERLEADLALCHDKLHTSHLEVHLSLCLCVHALIRVCVCVGQSYAAETFFNRTFN